MARPTPASAAPARPARGIASVFVLLALVLAVTAQLVTGFAMMADFNMGLLTAHLIAGAIAIVLAVIEWAWLAATRAGRHRLRGFAGAGSGPAEWSEAAFLAVASATIVLGALLAAAMYVGARLPFAPLFEAHRALAIAVAVLYLVHSALSVRRARGRRRLREQERAATAR